MPSSLSDTSRSITYSVVIEALATQCRVINALVLRETKTRYGNYKIGFLWALLEPLVGVSIFVAIFAGLRQDNPGGMPLVPFMLIGFLCYSLFKDPWTRMQGALSQSRNLLVFPQVTTFDVILARGVLEVSVGLFMLGLFLTLAFFLGFDIRCENPLGLLAVCGLLASLGVGLGFLFASLEPLVPSVKQISGAVLGRPLFFSSGLFFYADSMPAGIRDYLLFNPVLHMIELARSEFFYSFETQHGSWVYAGAWSLSALVVGLATHQAIRKKAVVLQ